MALKIDRMYISASIATHESLGKGRVPCQSGEGRSVDKALHGLPCRCREYHQDAVFAATGEKLSIRRKLQRADEVIVTRWESRIEGVAGNSHG